ncbi:MAG: LruC domain-containing protein, partial [Planctomycetes bacterium]|nr:LruC domain-containing protein [Planctomycetota bacterium]
RTISMMLKDTGLKNILTTGTAADRDGDLVPDAYDAFPDDPARAFSVTIPADGSLTIAFEDLFLQAQAGDADYNDFLARYTVTEILDSNNKLVELKGLAEAAVKLAGYNHLFGMVIDFNGQATLSVSYRDQNGLALSGGISGLPLSKKANIVLFPSTKDNIGYKTEFTLSFNAPLEQDQVSRSPYDPYLYVDNTGFDIHLIGQEPLTGSNNSVDTFQDAEGFPWALLVPSDWQHPPETVRIETVYPLFTQWRESFGAAASDWYLFPYDATNQPPDPVTGPSQTPIIVVSSQPRSYQLSLLDVDGDGQGDPDGDQVFFRSSALPSYMTLDEVTGQVTIISPVRGVITVDFWSEDEHGADTSGTPFSVTFNFIIS